MYSFCKQTFPAALGIFIFFLLGRLYKEYASDYWDEWDL